jgi:hypothetical protein
LPGPLPGLLAALLAPFLLALGVALAVAPSGHAQPQPQAEATEEPAKGGMEFLNLKVLPDDITRPELIGIMRGFAQGLGVRCQHCHVGEEGKPLSDFDFVSDAKPAKRQARVMLELVQRINRKVLPEVVVAGGDEAAARPALEVTCVTCHHGQLRPQTLQQALQAANAQGGTEAVVARYRELREEYYGGWTYDFSERSLLEAADELNDAGDPATAQALVDLNLEYFPESAFSFFVRGELLREAGDAEGAVAAYHRALELDPTLRPAQHRLQELAAPPEKDGGEAEPGTSHG